MMSAGGVELIAVDGQRLRVGPWRGSRQIGFLSPLGDGRPLHASTVRHALDHLASAGYGEVITGAISETDVAPFSEAGFRIRERLALLAHPMTDLDAAGERDASRVVTHRARRADRAAVLALDHLAFQPFWQLDETALDESLLATPVARFRVTGGSRPLRAQREPVTGYAVFGWSAERGYLQRLAVHPEHRGRGLAETLISDGLRWLQRRGALTTLVNTQEANERALRLYQRIGFVLEPHGLVVLTIDVRP
jgi:ribosomal protein S18 acetylase RimI-like enzyme